MHKIEFTILLMLSFLHFVAANSVLPSQWKQRGSIVTILLGEGLLRLFNSITGAGSSGEGGTIVVGAAAEGFIVAVAVIVASVATSAVNVAVAVTAAGCKIVDLCFFSIVET